jgi:hypothetical protein
MNSVRSPLALMLTAALAALGAGCDRRSASDNGQSTRSEGRDATISDADRAAREGDLAKDRSVTAGRGFADGTLTIGSKSDDAPTDPIRAGQALGPFALGMSVEKVRAIARRNSMLGMVWGPPNLTQRVGARADPRHLL